MPSRRRMGRRMRERMTAMIGVRVVVGAALRVSSVWWVLGTNCANPLHLTANKWST